jgi:hypothetical protein
MLIDERPTISAPDDDPYLWLEEIEGSRALAFVDAQNAATLARFSHAGLAAGPVAELVGIEGGVVSGVINLESPGVDAGQETTP